MDGTYWPGALVVPRQRRDQYDETDAKVRASRHGSRPRSKQRPRHDNAELGTVIAVDRGRFTVQIGNIHRPRQQPIVQAVKARELGRKSLVVGDLVRAVGDLSGRPDTLARLVGVDERRTVLRRSADDTDPVERIVVANADGLGIVVAAADPAPRFGFVDRCLVAAYDGGLQPFLIISKTDIAGPDEVERAYAGLDVPAYPVRRDSAPDLLLPHLNGRLTVLIGQSGVGKSTLVNALIPDAERATGEVNEVTGRGRHTSTSVVALPLPNSGWIIDTPGIRSLGLAHVNPGRVLRAFADLAEGVDQCPRACEHVDEHCALDDYVASGAAGPGGAERLASLRRILNARTSSDV